MQASTREALPRLLTLAVLVTVAAFFWAGWQRLGNVTFVADSTEFQLYAQTLDQTGHLPTKAENYEFSLPPGMPALAVGLARVARWVGPVDLRPVSFVPRGLRAALWALLAFAAGLVVLPARRRSRRWWAGVALAVALGLVAVLDAVSAATSFPWVPGLLPGLASILGLIVVSALLAREVWPDWRWAPPLAAFGTALLPFVYRIGLVFHPDPLFAFLVAAAVLLSVRASRRGWSVRAGLATGLLLALSALTRQSAVIAMACVALIALLLGRRGATRYLAAATCVVALVAGPWWAYQANRFGNPIQSNLDRPGYMLDGEPASFYLGGGGSVVTHPWRVLDGNYLFAKFHAGVWSDWTGLGVRPSQADQRALASTQSVLGFGGDALVLAGVLLLGAPALLRVARNRAAGRADDVLAALTLLFVVSWAGFVAEVLRFPQRDADPVQPHYLLFLVPAVVVLALGAARRLWARGGARRALLVAWTLLYAVSWTWALVTLV